MNQSTALFLRQNLNGISPSHTSSLLTLTRSWASQPPSDASTALKDSNPSAGSVKSATESSLTWTEVVHPESGKTYFWNQATGETTELGAPKPADDKGHSSDSHQSSQGQGGTETAGDRTEAPLPDRTGFYAASGAVIGAVLGWGSQFF